MIQRRGYENSAIDTWLSTNKARFVGEENQLDVKGLTAAFKTAHQYQDRDDLRYLRKKAGNHRSLLTPAPTVHTYALAGDFEGHVKGDQAGKGWHTEQTHSNGQTGYAYGATGWISRTKGTYYALGLTIRGSAKTGNNGNGTFFPSTMSMALIKSEALYVANTYTKNGQVIIGRGQKTGIMIECIIRDDAIESAYPYKPGW